MGQIALRSSLSILQLVSKQLLLFFAIYQEYIAFVVEVHVQIVYANSLYEF